MKVQFETFPALISSATTVFKCDDGRTAVPDANKAPHIPKVP